MFSTNVPWWAFTTIFVILVVSWIVYLLIQHDINQSTKAYIQLFGKENSTLIKTKSLRVIQIFYSILGIVTTIVIFFIILHLFS